MSAQIFDAIDMIDNVLNGYGNGTPTGLGVGMITLAFGCLLLAELGVSRTSASLTRKQERSEGSSTYRVDSR